MYALNSFNKQPMRAIGTKAHNLYVLKAAGYNIPEFVVIQCKTIDDLLSKHIKLSEFNQLFSYTKNTCLVALEEMRKKIQDIDFTPLAFKIQKTVKSLGPKLIIRSSALKEDTSGHSFAGIFESKTAYNELQPIAQSLKNVLAAIYSERVVFYMSRSGIHERPKIALIIQKYIEGDVSGVMFSSLNSQTKSGVFINANPGSSDSIVKGADCDFYRIESKSGKIEKKLHPKRTSPVLSESHLQKLSRTALSIERLFKCPQDIEWTLSNGKLYILQSRHVTQSFIDNERVWDNSNIAESYSGVVLPLTASFARELYKLVYMDLARASWISRKLVIQYEPIISNLLGFFNGRFYYNMLNWYRMLTLYPGFRRNKQNLDEFISIRSRAEIDEEHNENMSAIFRIKYYVFLLLKYLKSESIIKNYKNYSRSYYAKMRKLDLSRMSAKDIINQYYDYKLKFSDKWSIPVQSDFLAMTFYGAYQNYCRKNGIDHDLMIDMLSDINNVASAEQVAFLSNLSKTFHAHKELVEFAHQKRYGLCYNEIYSNPKYENLCKELKGYIDKFGGRFANELCLEADDLDTNPKYMIKLLLVYSGIPERGRNAHSDQILKKLSLPVHKRLILRYLLRKTRHYLKHREELRLLRSQSFSRVRNLFAAIGKKFAAHGIIEQWRDIFYLEINEIQQHIEGNSTYSNVKEVVALRKKQFDSFRKVEADDIFVTQGLPYASLSFRNMKSGENHLKGQGCSGGIVKGKVKVLNTYEILPNATQHIIVTKHTDPGWTPLFGLCKGLIVEHGGLLSHAAIVSRELNLPCIIGLKNATKIFKNGQTVTINGHTGEVKIE